MTKTPVEEFTLVFPLCKGRQLWIFLGLKKPRGPFVPHITQPFWTGFGGKIKERENPQEGITREMNEELGFPPREDMLLSRACVEVNRFDTKLNREKWARIHVFSYTMPRYQITPSREEYERGQWFPYRSLPYGEMLRTDRWIGEIFLPDTSFCQVTVDALINFSPLCIKVEKYEN